MIKIAFVNQRYGLEVNGGSEYYTRVMAEHLKDSYEVEVLTTKAVDYVTWANYYKHDEEIINDILVKRFSVEKERNSEEFSVLNQSLLKRRNHTDQEEQAWFDAQGPLASQLIQYVREHKDEYDVFVFVTYLYYLTVMAMPEVADKAVLIPTAHDEPYIYFSRYKRIFTIPKAIVYLTDEEKAFVNNQFCNQHIKNAVMGVGIDVPKRVSPSEFTEKYNLEQYITYVGRIDESKGCKWLFQYFEEYKKRNPNNELKLVLMGKTVLKIPKNPEIISLGFVSEDEKFSGIAGAKSLILPSEFESLSISVLEAMALSIPVIVNGRCEVLKGHCEKSNGGLYYKNYYEFEGCLEFVQNNVEVYEQMRNNAKQYVEKNFKWNVIIDKFKNIVDFVIRDQAI
ncbi:glycosyltransferase family 4 protein [Clostridium sp. E02]|uniref:glycosyltransferase family 4 protein n=1 Tax=Clostridium sp. E02 TaxID=2487134 RepID=UPI000F530D19|nr:glycosyltransferase family 4 protein [Clostridium sp. E02]